MKGPPSLWCTPRWAEGGKVAALAAEMTAIGSVSNMMILRRDWTDLAAQACPEMSRKRLKNDGRFDIFTSCIV